MSPITSENRHEWQQLAIQCEQQFPSVGKSVLVNGGRKHRRKTGKVKIHQVDRYADTRYCTNAQLLLRQMRGREGYAVQVESDSGELFWVKAHHVEVVSTATTDKTMEDSTHE